MSSNNWNVEAGRNYVKSQKNLLYAMLFLKFALVAYTAPHNLHAFGVQLTLSNFATSFISLLGVIVIEAALVLALSHYTHGWIGSREQHHAAFIASATIVTILMANAVASQLLYQFEAQATLAAETALLAGTPLPLTAPTGLEVALTFYLGFILPLTPILAIVVSANLVRLHPRVVAFGRAFSHMAYLRSLEQSSEAELSKASAEGDRAKIEATVAKARAEYIRQRSDADRSIADVEAAQHEYVAQVEMRRAVSQAVTDQLTTSIKTYISSEQFVKRIDRKASILAGREIGQMIDGMESVRQSATVVNATPDPIEEPAPPTSPRRPLAASDPIREARFHNPAVNGHPRPVAAD